MPRLASVGGCAERPLPATGKNGRQRWRLPSQKDSRRDDLTIAIRSSPMPLPTWVERLHLALWQHALPFVFGPPPTRDPNPTVEIHSGTCSAVEIGDRR